MGLKVSGADPNVIADIGAEIERLLPGVRGTRSVFAERPGEGYFLDIDWNRKELARYGVSMDEAQLIVQNAIGGENVTTNIRGRERYPINVRYMRDFRSSVDDLERVLVPVSDGKIHVPLAELATIKTVTGPAMLRDEDGLLTGYVYVDVAGRDPGSYVDEARTLLSKKLQLPAGYEALWSGQYQAMQRVRERLKTVLPLTLFVIVLLLYLNTRSMVRTAIVITGCSLLRCGSNLAVVPARLQHECRGLGRADCFARCRCGDRSLHAAVSRSCLRSARRAGRLRTLEELREAIVNGAAGRIRPKVMTVMTMLLGLVPIMWAHGTGADVMKRIAAPMVGGIFTSFVLELLVYPAIYEVWKWNFRARRVERTDPSVISL